MTGIPVHTASPINPNSAPNPSGVTRSTAAARYAPADSPTRPSQTSAAGPAISTVLAPSTDATAQPDSAVSPARTAAPQPTLTLQPTPTATIPSSHMPTASSPAAPQPGAVPSPFPSTCTEARRASIPPPPKVNEVPKPAAFYAPKYDGSPMPASSPLALSVNTSMSVPPLAMHQTQGTLLMATRAQAPAAITSSTTTPTTLTNMMPNDLSHPPGYVQDSRASFSERLPDMISPISLNQSAGSGSSRGGHSRGRSRGGTGILDGVGGNGELEVGDKGLWDTAVSWARTVGEKVIEGEDEVWKRINGKK